MSVRERDDPAARAVAGAAGAAYEPLLQALTERLAWRLAAAWEPDPGAGDTLVCVACWNAPGAALDAFAGVIRATVLSGGAGLPGRVFGSGQAAWIAGATVADGLVRREAAAAAGLRAAVGFPIRSERGTVGVVELFGEQPREPDAELLATIDLLGLSLGQLVERRRAERAGRAAEQRHRATLHASLDCVVTMDHDGCV
ncbi:MAG: two-component system, sensor histidine kinase and response regulator, partial [Baekduia sp.]|nr:two-component system, sensor histidine kinase and response regulator [Baekduia sp.]